MWKKAISTCRLIGSVKNRKGSVCLKDVFVYDRGGSVLGLIGGEDRWSDQKRVNAMRSGFTYTCVDVRMGGGVVCESNRNVSIGSFVVSTCL